MSKISAIQIRGGTGGNTGGLTAGQHTALHQLIHLADGVGGPFEGFFSGAVRTQDSSLIPTAIIWWSDETQTKKIVQKTIVYDNNILLPISEQWDVYDLSGTLSVASVVDDITYSGMFETSRTRTIIIAAGGSDIVTEATHKTLRQLIHLADGIGGPFEGFMSGAYREITPLGSPFPTDIIWWSDSSKQRKIMQKTIAYQGTIFPCSISWAVYGTDGMTPIITFTDTISFNNIFEQSRTRTFI